MKYKLLLIVMLVLFIGCIDQETQPQNNQTQNNQTKYPRVYGIDVNYCEGLSYEYELREADGRNVGYCIFPDKSECEAFEFIGGTCGRQFSLCEIKGYTLKIAIEPHETFNKTYAICIFPDGSYCKESDFFNRRCHVKW